MIKKVSFILLILVVALLVLGVLKKKKQRSMVAQATVVAVADPSVERLGNALRIYYPFRPPYTSENPVTNRNGYCLDVLHRIFPNATFVRKDCELPELVASLKDNATAALISVGAHPLVKGYPQATRPIGYYNVVILTPRHSSWRYTGPESLEQIRLGYTGDYLEAPIIAQHWEKHQNNPERVKHFTYESSLSDWMKMALAKEIDAFVATEATGTWEDAHSNLDLIDTFRISKPIARVPLYLTLSNADPAFAERVLEEYAEGLQRLLQEGTLSRLAQHYDLPDDTLPDADSLNHTATEVPLERTKPLE